MVSASQVAIGDRSPSPIGTSQTRTGAPSPAWEKQSTSLPGTSGFGNRDRRALMSQSFACFQRGTSGNAAKVNCFVGKENPQRGRELRQLEQKTAGQQNPDRYCYK